MTFNLAETVKTEHDRLAPEILSVPSMLSYDERALLHWAAREGTGSDGAIIDLGCFLGGSTLALGFGLTANESLGTHDASGERRVHSFDLFQVGDVREREYFDDSFSFEIGASTTQVYERNIAPIRGYVDVHKGNVNDLPAWEEPISLLFVDIAKSWETNDTVVTRFFPQLRQDALVIQQDLVHFGHPWCALTMELLADHFDFLGYVPFGSAVYRLRSPVLPDEVPTDVRSLINADDAVRLIARCAARIDEPNRGYLSLAAAVALVEWGDLPGAKAVVRELSERYTDDVLPWFSEHLAMTSEFIASAETKSAIAVRARKPQGSGGTTTVPAVRRDPLDQPRPAPAGPIDPSHDGHEFELAFVLAPRQNLFFAEFVEVLRQEIELSGVRTSLHVGNFPLPREDLVYVLVPPHEYFTLMHGRHGPSQETLKRTIFICAEQPNTSFFEENVELAPLAGAVFDINRDSVRAFAAHGISAEHLQVGWTRAWDRLHERERDIDVLFMGCTSDRRERALARFAESLTRRRAHLLISDNSRPNWSSSSSFRTGDEKWELLNRAKILVNIHQGESPYFEWMRMVQAMMNGAVVVSEHSLDSSPLQPGTHFLSGDVTSLPFLTELLLDDGHRRWELQTAAYNVLHDELLLSSSVEQLVATASTIARTAVVPSANDAFFTQPPPDPEQLPFFRDAAAINRGGSELGAVRRIAKDLKLELSDVRRRLARIEIEMTSEDAAPSWIQLVSRTPAYPSANPRVSILTALYNHADHIVGALESLLRSRLTSWEVIVVDDGSSDGSGEVVQRWMTEHPDVAGLLLRHTVNRGLPSARNTATDWARGEYCFILDADNEVYPNCLERLIDALDVDTRASFSYGVLERFHSGGSTGLLNLFPWQPERLRKGNYIDAMALIRTDALRRHGGFSVEPLLHGWEDYALWCRFAESDEHGSFVPEIVARYRTTAHSMISFTNVSVTDAFSVLIERFPRLMAGVVPPD